MTARKSDPIKKITTAAGKTRYRFIVDMPKKADGRRDQRCFTYDTLGPGQGRAGQDHR